MCFRQAADPKGAVLITGGVKGRAIFKGDIDVRQAFSRFGINHFSGNGPLTGEIGAEQEKACPQKNCFSY